MTNAFSTSISFNGEPSTWNAFDKQLLAIASDAIPGKPYGILGELVTPAEYLIFNADNQAYVALPNPGARPDIGSDHPTTVQQSAFTNRLKTWEFEMENYLKQEDAISVFKANFINSIDETSKKLINDPITGTMVITIRKIRSILKLEFGTLTPEDVDKLYAKATSSYASGMDMRIYLYSKTQAYAELAAVGELYGVQARTRELVASLKSVGHFEEVITFWQNTNTTVASQVTNATTLSTALITAYTKNKSLTAGSRHHVNAALTVEDIEKRIQAGIAAGVAAAVKGADSTCATCKVPVSGKNKSGRPLKYCGKCFAKFKADRGVA
jgi:hypothetical protein